MFRATLPLFSQFIKKSTGIVGLAVVPNPKPKLQHMYIQMLRELRAFPEDLYYRYEMETQCKFRLKVLEENDDVETIENLIGDGQAEELLQKGHKVLTGIIPIMLKTRSWEDDPDDPCIPLWVPTESFPLG